MSLPKQYVNDIDKAFPGRDNPDFNQYGLEAIYDKSNKPIVNTEMTDIPSEKQRQRITQLAFPDQVIKDASDQGLDVVDLDTAETNVDFIQESIKKMVSAENLLSSDNIRLKSLISKI